MTGTDTIARLNQLDQQSRREKIERQLLIEDAFKSRDIEVIMKAQQYLTSNRINKNVFPGNLYGAMNNSPRKSMTFDPLESTASMGYYYKPGALSYDILRRMSRAPIIRAIINTRKDQIADYTKPQPDQHSPGFIIKKRGIDEKKDLTDEDKRVIDELIEFLLDCGDEENRWGSDNFEAFIRKITEDSLAVDQINFEIIPNRAMQPTQFVAVDAGTIRIADSKNNLTNMRNAPKVNGYLPHYVQIYQNNVWAEFYPWEMCFGTRNSTTNIRQNGYGISELEDLMATVTAMLNADAYNGKFFRNGSAPRGALLIKGISDSMNNAAGDGVNSTMLDQFRNDWAAYMQGVGNAHKIPILDAEGFEWVDMHINNRDMEFSKFQEYLIKVACAIFKISPEEVGFPLGGRGAGLGSTQDGEEEKNYSKDKGLKPLLTFIAFLLNKYVIWPKVGRQYEFQFVGMDSESAKEEQERVREDSQVFMTVDEARKINKLDPLPNGAGEYPANSVIAQMVQSKQQMDMQQQQTERGQFQQDNSNTNPFLDSDGDQDPFAKGFSDWWDNNMFLK